MNLPEVAERLAIDLNTVVARFGGKQDLYVRFLKKMVTDPTYAALDEAVAAQDFPGIEATAHALKGVCANLGLERLRGASDRLVLAVRNHQYDSVAELYAGLQADYAEAMDVLQQLDA